MIGSRSDLLKATGGIEVCTMGGVNIVTLWLENTGGSEVESWGFVVNGSVCGGIMWKY